MHDFAWPVARLACRAAHGLRHSVRAFAASAPGLSSCADRPSVTFTCNCFRWPRLTLLSCLTNTN